MVDGNYIIAQSSDPQISTQTYPNYWFTADGKSGGCGFDFLVNGSVQGGGGFVVSYDEATLKYVYTFTSSGDPSAFSGVELTFLKAYKTKTIDSEFIPQLGGVLFRVNNGNLQVCFDGTWKTVSLT